MGNNTRQDINVVYTEDVTITAGTTSSEVDLSGKTLCGFSVGTVATAANVTFTVSATSGGTFRTMADKDDTDETVAIASNTYYRLDPSFFAGVNFFKIVMNASDTVTFTLHYRRVQ